jgi:type I restriction enzyme S subunit
MGAALFIKMFGDPLSNNTSWKIVPLGELGEIVTGNTPSRESPESPTEAVPWVKSDNLRGPSVLITEPAEVVSRCAVKQPRIVQDGAVLMTCIAGTPTSIGNCAIADREVAFNQQINAIVPRGSESAFVYAQLQLAKRRVQTLSTGGMKGMVSKSRLSNLPVMQPPLKLQQDFGKRFRRVACVSKKAELRCSHLDGLFASLQDRAFKGEL